MTTDDLTKKHEAVCDEASFIAFLSALAADRANEVEQEKWKPSSSYGPGANGWENHSIETFLESAHAWAEASMRGLEFYAKPSNPWKRCADILYMGKIYE